MFVEKNTSDHHGLALLPTVINTQLQDCDIFHNRILVQSWPRYVQSIHYIGNVYDLYNSNTTNHKIILEMSIHH